MEILSAGIPIEIKELMILLASSLAFAVFSAFSLEFPEEELTATKVNEALGDLLKQHLLLRINLD